MPICRILGCAEPATCDLGHCAACHADYLRAREELSLLAHAARRAHCELFACLTDREACTLAEHLVGRARLGPAPVIWAVKDFVDEAREAQAVRAAPTTAATRPRLRVIAGGVA